MGILKKLRLPKILYGIVILILAIPIGLFLYNKSVDWRGEELVIALGNVDVTKMPFKIQFSEWCQIDPVAFTESDLSMEARAKLQSYIETLEFDTEATKENDIRKYDRRDGGHTYSWWIQSTENQSISLFRISSVVCVKIRENNRTVREGVFREKTHGANDKFLDIFRK